MYVSLQGTLCIHVHVENYAYLMADTLYYAVFVCLFVCLPRRLSEYFMLFSSTFCSVCYGNGGADALPR